MPKTPFESSSYCSSPLSSDAFTPTHSIISRKAGSALWSLMRWPGSMLSRTTMGIVAWRVIISCTRLWRPWSKLSMSSPSARRATRDAEVRVGATKAWHAVAASSTTRRDIRDVEVVASP